MPVLITGGAGFIGSNLALSLLNDGLESIIFDNLSPQIHGSNPDIDSPLYNSIKNKISFIKGDVTQPKDWEKVSSNVDCVVHFAAETGTGQSMYEVERYARVNQMGTAILLDRLIKGKHALKKVIIASSRAIYGEGKYFSEKYGVVYPGPRLASDMEKGDFEVNYKDDKGALQLMPTDEESKINPSSIYGITKQNQEQMVLCTCAALGISAVAFRYQNVYGPGQSLTNPYTGILSIFSSLIQNGQSINVFEDGNESRDFVYISDVVNATKKAITGNIKGTAIYNVGSGIPVAVKDLAVLLLQAYNKKVPINISGNFRVGDIRHNYADLTKIKQEIGYSPEVMIEEGIKNFASWVSGQKLAPSSVIKSFEELRSKGLFK